jgi:hypothetical protein
VHVRFVTVLLAIASPDKIGIAMTMVISCRFQLVIARSGLERRRSNRELCMAVLVLLAVASLDKIGIAMTKFIILVE